MAVRDRNPSHVKREAAGSSPVGRSDSSVAQLVERLKTPTQFSPLKTCPTCKKTKPISEFNSQKKYCLSCHNAKGAIWREINKEKNKKSQQKHNQKRRKLKSYRLRQRQYSKNNYQKNKVIYINKSKIQKEKTGKIYQQRIFEYLLAHSCVDCGETNPIVLTFDHVRGEKKFNISESVLRLQPSWEKVVVEINKCDIRCANCHLIKTATERKFWKIKILDKIGAVRFRDTS